MSREGDLSGTVGLCADCSFTRKVVSGKGSRFWLCRRSDSDPAFRKYPVLPVLSCTGYVKAQLTTPGEDNEAR